MANFYARYPASNISSSALQTVQGEGTAGTPVGGVLTIQGDPAGTPIPISGSITATNPSVAVTGAAVPADATYTGMVVAGNLTGMPGNSNGLIVSAASTIKTGSLASPTTGDIIASFDASDWTHFSLQMTITSANVQVQESDDNVTFYPVLLVQAGTVTATPVATVSTTNLYVGDIDGKYVKVVATANSAGTTSATLFLMDGPRHDINARFVGLLTGANVIGAVTQSGTWTVQPGNTANTTPWLATINQGGHSAVVTVGGALTVDGSASTQPISGTVTANAGTGTFTVGGTVTANAGTGTFSVAGTGTAGTANAGVVTVQGIASMTPLLVTAQASANIIGKVGIDQTTPGTTNAIQATSGTTAAWQAEGSIAGGSITNAFATVFTPSASTKILVMRNNTDNSVSVSMDAGTTTNFVLDSGDQIAIDFVANGLVSTTTAIQIKYTGSATTTGSFRVNGCH